MKKSNTPDFKHLSQGKVYYHFFSLRFYVFGIGFLGLMFFCFWFPNARIELIVSSEPFIENFEVKLDSKVEKVIFNLETIPAKIINLSERENWPEYEHSWQLVDEKSGKSIIFRRDDLKSLLDYKIRLLLGAQKRIWDSEGRWQITLINKDISIGQARINVFLEEEVVRDYDSQSLKQGLVFKSLEFAKEKLEALPDIKEVRIKNQPRFYRRMPFFPNRISIILEILGTLGT